MVTVMRQVAQVAKTNSTVLVTGETGTGKELVAREIHAQSSRSGKQFVAVNCSALVETLVESELFGHEKGAFTGAVARRIGKFQQAHGGTIFLDEIAELSAPVQAKLLRVLQERQVVPVGSNREVSVDARVIAATHRDLETRVAEGTFRQDLYYRLRVLPIHIPALRKRREDIPLITQAVLERKIKEMKCGRAVIADDAMNRLVSWDWPGNVRELENVLENALVHSEDTVLGEELFTGLIAPGVAQLGYTEARAHVLEQFERSYVGMMLRECDANVSEAARRMDMTRQGLQKMMKRLKLDRNDSKEN